MVYFCGECGWFRLQLGHGGSLPPILGCPDFPRLLFVVSCRRVKMTPPPTKRSQRDALQPRRFLSYSHPTPPFVLQQDLLPVEGVTACVTTFFVDRRLSPAASGSGDRGGNDKRALLFARAALDLIMVLHARLPPSLFKTKASTSATRRKPAGMAPIVLTASAKKTGAGVVPAGRTATAVKVVAAVEEPPMAAVPGRSLPRDGSEAGCAGVGVDAALDVGCGGGCSVWVMILRALSLGARSAQPAVATHALRLLTKVSASRNTNHWSEDALTKCLLLWLVLLDTVTASVALVRRLHCRTWARRLTAAIEQSLPVFSHASSLVYVPRPACIATFPCVECDSSLPHESSHSRRMAASSTMSPSTIGGVSRPP